MYKLKELKKKTKKPTFQGCKGGGIYQRPKQQSKPPIRTDYREIEKSNREINISEKEAEKFAKEKSETYQRLYKPI